VEGYQKEYTIKAGRLMRPAHQLHFFSYAARYLPNVTQPDSVDRSQ